jgi:hypothetical protein
LGEVFDPLILNEADLRRRLLLDVLGDCVSVITPFSLVVVFDIFAVRLFGFERYLFLFLLGLAFGLNVFVFKGFVLYFVSALSGVKDGTNFHGLATVGLFAGGVLVMSGNLLLARFFGVFVLVFALRAG